MTLLFVQSFTTCCFLVVFLFNVKIHTRYSLDLYFNPFVKVSVLATSLFYKSSFRLFLVYSEHVPFGVV